ncbi:MAG: hypothetical protein KAI66_20560 [Lentisphaeria bacterium]|nr:hypothetical protein [Lentisphaeria bacterium]
MNRNALPLALAAAILVGGCVGGTARRLNQDNALNVSWGDQIVIGKGAARLDTPERIRDSLSRWQDLGRVTTVYWRISSWVISEYHKHRKKGFEWYYGPLKEIESRCDPREEAQKACHDLGMKIYPYLTIYDEGSPAHVLYGDNAPFPWQSKFTIEHPEFLACDRSGEKRHHGVMEYWHPEVRAYKIGQILRFIDTYDYDGVYICTRTHSPPAESADMYGFNQPVVDEFRKRHGIDIRTQDFDVQAWRDLRGEGLTLFFRELRGALRKRGKRLAVGIPRLEIIGPPYGNMTLHWRDWVREELIDEIVLGVNSGNFHYPSQRGKDRKRGYLASGDEHWGMQPLLRDIAEKYAPLCHRHGVTLRTTGSSSFAVPPLDGHMIGAASFGSHSIRVVISEHKTLRLQGQTHTIDFQVRPKSLTDYPRLLSKYNHSLGDEGRGWEVMIDKKGAVLFRIGSEGADQHFTSKSVLKTGVWNHVACGFDTKAGTVRISVNGQTTHHKNVQGLPPRDVSTPVWLGVYGGGGRPFHGGIAALRFWNERIDFSPDGQALTPQAAKPYCLEIAPDALRFDGSRKAVMRMGDIASAIAEGPTPGTKCLVFGAK